MAAVLLFFVVCFNIKLMLDFFFSQTNLNQINSRKKKGPKKLFYRFKITIFWTMGEGLVLRFTNCFYNYQKHFFFIPFSNFYFYFIPFSKLFWAWNGGARFSLLYGLYFFFIFIKIIIF